VADDLDAFDGGEEAGEDRAERIGSDDAWAERAFKFDGGVERGGAEVFLGEAVQVGVDGADDVVVHGVFIM
jgi:hypothetical protein